MLNSGSSMHYLSRFFYLVVVAVIFVATGCTPGDTDSGPTEAVAVIDTPVNADSLARVQAIADSLSSVAAIATADVYYARCGDQVLPMHTILEPIAISMQAQKIPYKISQDPVDEWRDCSGNFLRLSSYLAAQCPGNDDSLPALAGVKDFVLNGNNTVPNSRGPRSTRGLGKWYHDRDRFTPIFYDGVTDVAAAPQDLITHRNLIKPGAVLWFSRQRPMSAGGLEDLWTRNEARTQINHMGTVTSVTRDEAGNVIGYKMYHGHGREGNHASVTEHHYWEWPATFTGNGKTYPPLGYWDQYVVGIGSLLPAEAPPAGV